MRIPATVLLLAFAACGGGGGGDDDAGGPDAAPPDADIPDVPQCLDSRDALYAHNFLHGNATLRANDFTIAAGTQSFGVPAPRAYYLNSDSETIELEWGPNGVPMRLYIYFTTDGVDWWADELRTYDGDADTPDWIYYTGEMFRCPLGKHYSGDLTLTADATNEVAGSITFQDLWLRAYVNSEPPGVQMPLVEELVRPYCAYALACGYPYTMNTCIHNLGRTVPAFRPDVYQAATQCEIVLPSCTGEAHLACWQDNRPASLPYHDAFRTQCEQYTTACFGAVDPDCAAIDVSYWTDLVYYSEEFVSALYTCVAPGTPCSAIGFCLDQAAAPYGLDL